MPIMSLPRKFGQLPPCLRRQPTRRLADVLDELLERELEQPIAKEVFQRGVPRQSARLARRDEHIDEQRLVVRPHTRNARSRGCGAAAPSWGSARQD
ncbi:MAG: hypothetical protein KGK07_16620, partial [Chloroflexota bacterium]|nr:hypothetical protein [Chloroflexota bacterium]